MGSPCRILCNDKNMGRCLVSEHLLSAYHIGALEIMLGVMDIPSLRFLHFKHLLLQGSLMRSEYEVQ